ncbi:MAG: carbonic anhydrase family protein [Rhodocyclaceae bacterium]|nr:carbonic anhydrase family protein [Rhodocyclaceae bacterium]
MPDSHTGVRYTTIDALNSYNCKKREYMTLKRIYVDAKGNPVREEKVEAPRTIEIGAGSFEEKLLPEVCKPRAVSQMQEVAEQIKSVMAGKPPPTTPGAGAKTTALHGQKAEPVTVADAGSKAHLIELPRIDPTKVDNPPPPKAPQGKPEIRKPAKPALDKAIEKSLEEATGKAPASAPPQAAPQTPEATRKAAPAADTLSPNYHTGNVSRAEIERQLATFGPRKARAPKSAQTVEAPSAAPRAPVPWSYEGKGGPEFWSHLSPDNKACASGRRQSPINISDGIRVDLEPIKFNYGPSGYSVIDDGHTIQVNVAEGLNISIMGRTYQLIQFHFHKPAEERVNGRGYDMVAHLVHKDAEGHLAVIAVLMENGPEHPLIQTIWNNLPLEQGMVVSPAAPIDLNKLLPEKRDYWTYMGSLTTPPCTEDVLWMVMKQPLQVSAEQIGIFGRLYPNNARPIQPGNNRLIKESR